MNRATEIDARFLWKGAVTADALLAFVRRATLASLIDADDVQRVLDQQAERFELTPREAGIAALAFAGTDRREDLAEAQGISSETVKTHVQRLLNKTGADTLRDLGQRLREVVASSRS